MGNGIFSKIGNTLYIHPKGYDPKMDPGSGVYRNEVAYGAAKFNETFNGLRTNGSGPANPLQKLEALQTALKDPRAQGDGKGGKNDVAARAFIMGVVASYGGAELRTDALQMGIDALSLPKTSPGYMPMSDAARRESIASLQSTIADNKGKQYDQPLERQFQGQVWGQAKSTGWIRP